MKVYKLTDQKFLTRNNTLWGENITYETSGKGELCSDGWLHFYHNPILAILLNPIHADISNPILWEAEAEGRLRDDHGLKGGCTKLTTIKQLPLPEVTLEQRVELAIRCAMEVYKDENWLTWAEKWLSGEDRSKESAYAAYAAHAAKAAYCAAYYAAYAADAAYYAAYYAADAAAAAAADAAYYAVYYAADAAANAAANAAKATEINFDVILQQVFG